MKRLSPLVLALVLGCASYSGSSLVPGQSTLADVESTMGKPLETMRAKNGETVLWYSRLPYGRENYAARIGADGRLIGVEQRLTYENFALIQPNVSRADDVRALLGPPYTVSKFSRMQREIWEYQTPCRPTCLILYVQMSPDGVVREVYHLLDPVFLPGDGSFDF